MVVLVSPLQQIIMTNAAVILFVCNSVVSVEITDVDLK